MDLFIDNKSGAPIYDQIYTQIKDQIIQGALEPDEAMPAIRGLARELRISVITTKRAYDELEKEGFLYSVPAKGFFVDVYNRQPPMWTITSPTAARSFTAAPGRKMVSSACRTRA